MFGTARVNLFSSSRALRHLRHKSSFRRRLACQPLEDRLVLAAVTVDTNNDIVDFGGSRLIGDLPGPDGLISLREALIATNNTSGADEIGFQRRGVFATPQTIELSYGQLTISDDVVLSGPGATELSIDAQGNSRVLNVDDSNAGSFAVVRIGGVTLRNGRTSGVGEGGAGIRNLEQLTLENSHVENNATLGTDSDGAGILNLGGKLAVRRSTISRNDAFGDMSDGGGINNFEGDLSVTDSTLFFNRVYGDLSFGGAIFTNTDLATNQATVTNSTISSNFVGDYLAAGSGGAIYNLDGRLTISNSTVTKNGNATRYATTGGGVASFGDNLTVTTVQSSIISDNTTGDVDYVGGSTNSFVSDGNNLIGFGNAIGSFYHNDLRYVTDPGLSYLGYYGGVTPTHLLLEGSPAINWGANPLGLASDQRGMPFVRDDEHGVDVGASERQTVTAAPFPLVVNAIDDHRDGGFGDGGLSLREAIEFANGSVGPELISFKTDGVFSSPQTIQLANSYLKISDSLVVEGPGAAMLTVLADDYSSVLRIDGHDPSSTSDVVLIGLTISGGGPFVPRGGGIINRQNLTIVDSEISGNGADLGGGIYNYDGDLVVITSLITANQSYDLSGSMLSGGGGIANGSGDVTIIDSTIAGNEAGLLANGGGILHRGGRLSIFGSTISGNSAANLGGGIYNNSDLTGMPTTITNSTISGNSAARGGGVSNQSGLLKLYNSTITNNSATEGGGVVGGSTASTRSEVFSTIIADNLFTDVDTLGGAASSFYSYGANLIGDGNSTGSFLPILGDQVGVSDPGLGPLAPNGGVTKTHAVLVGSPAIDEGAMLPGLTSDQRGLPFARNVGADADVGAVERQRSAFL